MASKDNILDILEKLTKDNIDYVLLTIEHGDDDMASGAIHFNLPHENSPTVALDLIKDARKAIKKLV